MTNATMTAQEQEVKEGVSKAFAGKNVESKFDTVTLGPNIVYEMLRFTIDGCAFAVPRDQVAKAPSLPNLVSHIESEIKTMMANRK